MGEVGGVSDGVMRRFAQKGVSVFFKDGFRAAGNGWCVSRTCNS